MNGASYYSSNNFNSVGVRKIADALFFIAYAILLIRSILLVSTIKAYFDYDGLGYKVIPRVIAYVIILFKICLFDRYEPKKLLFLFGFSALMVVSIAFNQFLSLADIVAIILGAHDIPLKKIVKCYFKISCFLCILFIFFSLTGIIENYTTFRGDKARYAFGNIYATDFAAMIFYLQLSNAYLRKKKYTIITVLFWVIVAVLLMKLCDARLDSILILSFAAVMFLKAKAPKFFRLKFIKFILIYGLVLSCIVALMLHAMYNPENGFLAFVNKLISGRLYLGKIVIDDYGFSLFGKNVEMQGWGWSSEWNSELGYYYVDSGFLSIALCYGFIVLLIIVMSFTIVARREIHSGLTVLPIIILFIGVTSIIDQHVMQLAYNPFLFAIGSAISICSTKKIKKGKYLSVTKALTC